MQGFTACVTEKCNNFDQLSFCFFVLLVSDSKQKALMNDRILELSQSGIDRTFLCRENLIRIQIEIETA